MLEVIYVEDNSNKEAWTRYVNSKPEAHFYYDYRWRRVLEESLGHRCFYLLAREADRGVGAFPVVFIKSNIMPPCLVSVPFFNYGGILADTKEAGSLLLARATDISKKIKARYIEIRSVEKLGLPLVTREHKVTMWLGLCEAAEEEWKRLDPKVRNQIRKAQGSGLVFKSGKDDALDEFYGVFCRNMRDLGTPVLGRSFFKNILRYFPQESHIFIVEYSGKPIGGAFALCHRDTMEIPWASSIRSFNKLCPNEFMYWHAIEYAISGGLKVFDFGRCTKDSGTYGFKSQWKPQVKQLYWQYSVSDESVLPAEDPKKSRYAFLTAAWKRLPLVVANRIGPHIAREIAVF